MSEPPRIEWLMLFVGSVLGYVLTGLNLFLIGGIRQRDGMSLFFFPPFFVLWLVLVGIFVRAIAGLLGWMEPV